MSNTFRTYSSVLQQLRHELNGKGGIKPETEKYKIEFAFGCETEESKSDHSHLQKIARLRKFSSQKFSFDGTVQGSSCFCLTFP